MSIGTTERGDVMTTKEWSIGGEAGLLAYYDATVRDAHRYAMRLTGGDRSRAEDLVQDAFVGLLRRAKAGTIEHVGAGWIMVAIRHRFLDQLRSRQREDRRLRLVWSRPADAEEPTIDVPLAGIDLNDRERAALTLRYVDGFPVPDVADALGTTVRATESLLMRAKARVRAEVRDA